MGFLERGESVGRWSRRSRTRQSRCRGGRLNAILCLPRLDAVSGFQNNSPLPNSTVATLVHHGFRRGEAIIRRVVSSTFHLDQWLILKVFIGGELGEDISTG
jgi:hypothetical protein